MPQSYSKIILHTIFGTKFRQPFIDEAIEPELYSIMVGELGRFKCTVIEIGGTSDHVHIIHSLPRSESVAKIMRDVKSVSTKWIKKKGDKYREFGWQDGYATFSVDYRNQSDVRNYVKRQKEHHGVTNKRMAFKDEFEKFMMAYRCDDYTPEYVFPEPKNLATLSVPEARLT